MSEHERDIIDPTGQSVHSPQIKRWRGEFPYHWDADEMVSRREFLHLAVYASGALFSVTALIAILGRSRRRPVARSQRITVVEKVPEGQAFYFNYPSREDQAVLLHLSGGRFVAYSQKCTHLSCAVYYQSDQKRLFCPCHDGVFDPQTGSPTAGPPQRRLPRIKLLIKGNLIYALGREA